MAKIPEKYKNYTFNENDYLPEKYEVADKEKEELIRKLAKLITDDISFHKASDIQNEESGR